MSIPPEADAFVRAILRDPADETTRLVFADWLDDTGEPHNVAWAAFIRANAEADRHEPGSPDGERLARQATRLWGSVNATLTVTADEFVLSAAALLRILPEPNITVRLGVHQIPRAVIEFVPESVARDNLVLPLAAEESRLSVVSADPGCFDTLERLEFVLNTSLVMVGAEADDIRAAIDGHYGNESTVCVESVSYLYPDLGSEGGNAARMAGGLFIGAFTHKAPGFEVELGTNGGRVTYLPNARNEVFTEDVPAAVFARLHDHLAGLRVGRSCTVDGLFRREVEVPAAITDRFPIDFDVRVGEQPPWWLRVTFRWERNQPEPPPRRRRP